MVVERKSLNSAIKNMLCIKKEKTIYNNDYMQKIKNVINVRFTNGNLNFEVVDGFRTHNSQIAVDNAQNDVNFEIIVNIESIFKSKEKYVNIEYSNDTLKFFDTKNCIEYPAINIEYFDTSKMKNDLQEKNPIFEIYVTPKFLIDALRTFTEDNTPTKLSFYGEISPIKVSGIKEIDRIETNYVLPIARKK